MSGAISSVCMTQQGLTASDFGAAGEGGKEKSFFREKRVERRRCKTSIALDREDGKSQAEAVTYTILPSRQREKKLCFSREFSVKKRNIFFSKKSFFF